MNLFLSHNRLILILLAVLATAAILPGQDGELMELYRHLHRNPELSFQEKATAARLAQEFRRAGLKVTEGVGGYGVVGILPNGPGPVVLLRADMDALPVTEDTGLPYASRVKASDQSGREVGVMHACGHDVHMTVLVGAIRELASRKAAWSGTLVCIAQPAEERSGGARAMLADGLYERFPLPDYALALHVTPDLAAGEIGICPGYAMANVDMLDIRVRGRGGHGAIPESTLDPVVLSARIVLALQTIVSREISPLDPAVITVGSIHGGTKGNVIPDEVKLELTLRSYSEEVRRALLQKIERICRGEAMASGVPEAQYPVLELREEYTPSLYNDPELTDQLAAAWKRNLGKARVQAVPPKMVGEDFGRYGRTDAGVPICLFWLGASDPEALAKAREEGKSLPALHTPRFAPDARTAIRTGTEAMTAAVLELMKE